MQIVNGLTLGSLKILGTLYADTILGLGTYSVATTAASILTTDTISVALGKLEKGLNDISTSWGNYLLKTDIADWAKSSTKPSYSWDEIENTPDFNVDNWWNNHIGNPLHITATTTEVGILLYTSSGTTWESIHGASLTVIPAATSETAGVLLPGDFNKLLGVTWDSGYILGTDIPLVSTTTVADKHTQSTKKVEILNGSIVLSENSYVLSTKAFSKIELNSLGFSINGGSTISWSQLPDINIFWNNNGLSLGTYNTKDILIPYASNDTGGLITKSEKAILTTIGDDALQMLNTYQALDFSAITNPFFEVGPSTSEIAVTMEVLVYSSEAGVFLDDSVNFTLPSATSSTAGVMSASDKVKLDGMKPLVVLTLTEYDALASKDSNTLYLIQNVN